MNVKNAADILNEKFLDKKIIGRPAKYRESYAFIMVSKDTNANEPIYDSTVTLINPITGNISETDAFDIDYMNESKPIEEEEL